LQFAPHLYAQLGVEIRQRLVEQENGRLAHDRAAHRHPLALPARQFARASREQVRQLEDFGGALHAGVDVGFRSPLDLQPVRHVVVHAHVRVQGVVLEHHRDVAVLRFQIVDDALADRDFARRDRLQPSDHAQQRRLAAARGSDHHDEFAVVDLHRDALNDLDGSE